MSLEVKFWLIIKIITLKGLWKYFLNIKEHLYQQQDHQSSREYEDQNECSNCLSNICRMTKRCSTKKSANQTRICYYWKELCLLIRK